MANSPSPRRALERNSAEPTTTKRNKHTYEGGFLNEQAGEQEAANASGSHIDPTEPATRRHAHLLAT